MVEAAPRPTAWCPSSPRQHRTRAPRARPCSSPARHASPGRVQRAAARPLGALRSRRRGGPRPITSPGRRTSSTWSALRVELGPRRGRRRRARPRRRSAALLCRPRGARGPRRTRARPTSTAVAEVELDQEHANEHDRGGDPARRPCWRELERPRPSRARAPGTAARPCRASSALRDRGRAPRLAPRRERGRSNRRLAKAAMRAELVESLPLPSGVKGDMYGRQRRRQGIERQWR